MAVGQGRSREAVARPATALTDWRWSGLFATSGLSISGKVWADGDWIIDIIHVLSKTYGNGVWEKTQKLKTLQPHAPSRRRCFYLAVLIERLIIPTIGMIFFDPAQTSRVTSKD